MNGRITSPFGLRDDPKTGKPKLHGGVDFGVPRGTPVKSTGGGKVIRAGWQSDADHGKGFGQRVTIDHGNGTVSIYGHLDSIGVVLNQPVKRGDVIGKSGNTGRSTGPHLHYEERRNGRGRLPTFDPEKAPERRGTRRAPPGMASRRVS